MSHFQPNPRPPLPFWVGYIFPPFLSQCPLSSSSFSSAAAVYFARVILCCPAQSTNLFPLTPQKSDFFVKKEECSLKPSSILGQ